MAGRQVTLLGECTREHLAQHHVISANYGGLHIKARKSDWHPDNPKIRPSVWSVAIILTVIFAVALIAAVGAYVNGNGMPFLS